MLFCSLKGNFVRLKDSYKYLIDWDGDSLSLFQKNIKLRLKPFWKNDLVFEELPVVGTKLRIDFYNQSRKIALEVSGHQHYTLSKHFHSGTKDFLKQIIRDEKKKSFCDINNIELIEIYEYEAKEISDAFLKKINLI